MKEELLIFKQIHTHLLPLIQGKSNFEFFGESETRDEHRITELAEHEIVDWLFKNPMNRSAILSEILGTSENYFSRLRISKPIIEHGEKPGDVDILISPENHPELSVAIECKRVKVTVLSDGTENVNRLTQAEKGVKQANQLNELGFHKSYVLFFILTDGQYKTKYNTLFRHVDGGNISGIYDIPWNQELNQGVGVIYVQITQPTGLHYNQMNSIGICIHKVAEGIEQRTSLTEKIKKLKKMDGGKSG